MNNTCQHGYSLIEDHCFRVHTSPRLVWEDAQLDCLNQSGYLAIIDTQTKLQAITSLLQSMQRVYRFQIGLIRDLSSWSWLDGTTVDTALFKAGYPQITEASETCIAFHGYDPAIVNVLCDHVSGYACQSAEGERKS